MMTSLQGLIVLFTHYTNCIHIWKTFARQIDAIMCYPASPFFALSAEWRFLIADIPLGRDISPPDVFLLRRMDGAIALLDRYWISPRTTPG